MIKTNKIPFWLISQGPLGLLKFKCQFWVSQTILPFPNTSAPAQLPLPVPHVSTKPLKSSLSLHAKIFFYIWNERIKHCNRYYYKVNWSCFTCKLLMSVHLDIKSLYPHLKVNWNMLMCKICIALRLVVNIFPWCNANFVPFPSGTLVAHRMGNRTIYSRTLVLFFKKVLIILRWCTKHVQIWFGLPFPLKHYMYFTQYHEILLIWLFPSYTNINLPLSAFSAYETLSNFHSLHETANEINRECYYLRKAQSYFWFKILILLWTIQYNFSGNYLPNNLLSLVSSSYVSCNCSYVTL